MRYATSEVNRYVSWQIHRLVESHNDSRVRASLAKLRRGIGKMPGALPELWEFTIENIPEQYHSKNGEPSYAEWAIHTSMTLFALHQQGSDIDEACMNTGNRQFAEAVAGLIDSDDELMRVKRRFDAAVTSQSMAELAHHTRGLIQLLKSKKIGFDYPRFAHDLYLYQFPDNRGRVLLNWGEQFYRTYTTNMSAKSAKKEEIS